MEHLNEFFFLRTDFGQHFGGRSNILAAFSHVMSPPPAPHARLSPPSLSAFTESPTLVGFCKITLYLQARGSSAAGLAFLTYLFGLSIYRLDLVKLY